MLKNSKSYWSMFSLLLLFAIIAVSFLLPYRKAEAEGLAFYQRTSSAIVDFEIYANGRTPDKDADDNKKSATGSLEAQLVYTRNAYDVNIGIYTLTVSCRMIPNGLHLTDRYWIDYYTIEHFFDTPAADQPVPTILKSQSFDPAHMRDSQTVDFISEAGNYTTTVDTSIRFSTNYYEENLNDKATSLTAPAQELNMNRAVAFTTTYLVISNAQKGSLSLHARLKNIKVMGKSLAPDYVGNNGEYLDIKFEIRVPYTKPIITFSVVNDSDNDKLYNAGTSSSAAPEEF